MNILVINGPNLNMLGRRDSQHYGSLTLNAIEDLLRKKARELGAGAEQITLQFFQSNHEGALIDFIQKESFRAQGILINPGALTHYSYALRDALADAGVPVVEAHLSDIAQREPFRRISVIADIVTERVIGLKERSYIVGLEKLIARLRDIPA
ncbi:3-dehydroquinate dehydratase [Candidatus Uhrbacteria bacterium RIFCSPHIGHO2_12_FULL_54_23]|uniref:3-dehydroquinate dehydratase n=2 Tax=Candidatus Uhriibacteriota TaxID=1752732 RepID=A0A1F7ULX6_9BACT|nr:MAG: 3-dehydroquinate dehydratase [Candidatus Uhrbacteria bacterium RIFCSPHIGHO2_12_FULL_54_23]OGL90668.1 MAG: 3-dehydroquinate dehydratase [Candidatus Uhrbacteria bacterium RIFCSPLOWO2_02_FULL_54_37]